MVVKAVQAMLNSAVQKKQNAVKNVVTVKNAGQAKVLVAKAKAEKNTGKALDKAFAAEAGVATVIEKIDEMVGSLRAKADQIEAIAHQ